MTTIRILGAIMILFAVAGVVKACAPLFL